MKMDFLEFMRGIMLGVVVLGILFMLAVVADAGEREQTRVYDSNGRSIGTAAPQSDGTTRYYDSRGNSIGTTTTAPSGTTTFYGPRGNVNGHSYGPPARGR
jgi:hypothetical protein